MMKILHGFIYRNQGNSGSIVYIGSCRVSIIKTVVVLFKACSKRIGRPVEGHFQGALVGGYCGFGLSTQGPKKTRAFREPGQGWLGRPSREY